jgi:hypothetical protein
MNRNKCLVVFLTFFSFLSFSFFPTINTSASINKNLDKPISFTFFPQKINEPLTITVKVNNPIKSTSIVLFITGKSTKLIDSSLIYPPKTTKERDELQKICEENIRVNGKLCTEWKDKFEIMTAFWKDGTICFEFCTGSKGKFKFESITLLPELKITVKDYDKFFTMVGGLNSGFQYSNLWSAAPEF